MAYGALKCLKCTGSSVGTETDCSKTPKYLSVDASSDDVNANPIKAPISVISSPTYSFETWLRWEVITAPDGYIQNVKIFGSSAQPDAPNNKMTILWGTRTSASTPVNSASSYATTAQHSNYYSAATGLAIPLVPGDSKLDAVGEKTYWFVSQLKLEFGVAQGLMTPQVYNMTWEEL